MYNSGLTQIYNLSQAILSELQWECHRSIMSFKLPVLSCSQLLKITGFKNTIYNVLALDRCSTCVTVLIYKTKMVTVNYVFLCAFFKHWGRSLLGHGNS